MNIRYKKWLDIQVVHNYFLGGICNVLSFQAIAQTVRKMKNYDLRGTLYKNIFSLYFGYNADNGPLNIQQLTGMGDLYFQILCSDNNFLNYTDIPLPGNDTQILFLSNREDQSNNIILQQNQYVSAADQVINTKSRFSVAVPAIENNVLNVKNLAGEDIITATLNGLQNKTFNIDLSGYDVGYYSLWINNNLIANYFVTDFQLANNCIGILHIAADQLLAASSHEPISPLCSFNSRSTFWKYSVLIAPDRQINIIQMSIENSSGIEYNDPVNETIVGGAIATVYTSTQPVPLKQVSESNQTLKISYSNIFSDRNGELNLKLPDPDISSLQINNTNRSLISTKLIYV